MLNLFDPATQVIRGLTESGITVIVEGIAKVADGDYPLMVFPNEILSMMSHMGAVLAFDLIESHPES